MQTLSPIQTVEPAWQHTRLLLQTIGPGTRVKLALCFMLGEAGALLILPVQAAIFLRMPAPNPAARSIALFAATIITLFELALYGSMFYFGSRMQAVLIDVVLLGETRIAPLWQRHSRTVWNWMALKLVPSALICALLFYVMTVVFSKSLLHAPQPAPIEVALRQSLPPDVVHAMLRAWTLLLVTLTLAWALYSQMRDFVLPQLVIDGVSPLTSVRAWLGLWRDQPGEMLGYFFFRYLLVIGAYLGCYLATFLVTAVAGGSLFAAGLAVWHGTGVVSHGVLLIAAVFLAAVLYLLMLATLFGSLGLICLFFQCYSLYFLGGRWPRLGAILNRWPSAGHDSL